MSALPPDEFLATRPMATPAARTLVQRWVALHAQAGELAELAELQDAPFDNDMPVFADRIATATEWQRRLAGEGIEDIDAIMQPGLTALRIIAARNQDAKVPALALWREFHAARNSVLRVVIDQAERAAADAA